MMKKALAFVLMITLAFGPAAVASAEGGKPLSALCDAAFELLFSTRNVTLEGEANFSLDGDWFKTAKAKYIQDGDRSWWDLKLTSPKLDGTTRENGYTIIADGSKIYVMEVFRPGIYKTGTGAPQSTILRDSVQMELMKEVIRAAAALAETEGNAVRVEENVADKSLRIEMNAPAPEWFDMSLNILAEYAAKRYFHMDYDQIGAANMVPMSYYLTVTEGILACTVSETMKHADITVRMDPQGQIEGVSGSVSLLLSTARDEERTLDLTFELAVSDRGTSHVGTFSPSEYNVTLVEGGMNLEDVPNTEVDEFTQEKLTEQAKAAWEQAGYTLDPSTFGYSYRENGRYCTELTDAGENLFLSCVTNIDGKVLELRNTDNVWQDKNFNYDDPYPDAELAEEAGEKVMEYLKKAEPEDVKRIEHLKLQCWYEANGELYFEFCEDPIAQDWDGFLVVVQVKPEWKLEYYSCFSNG